MSLTLAQAVMIMAYEWWMAEDAPPPLPEPAEFATDIKELAPYAKPVEERAKATEARRKLAGLGA